MALWKTGSKGAGLAEIMIGGVFGMGAGANAYESFGAAAKEFGDTGRILDGSNVLTLLGHEGMMAWGSTYGRIGLAPRDWYIGEGYNYLSNANWSTLVMAAMGAIVIAGFGDLGRGIQDIGGRPR